MSLERGQSHTVTASCVFTCSCLIAASHATRMAGTHHEDTRSQSADGILQCVLGGDQHDGLGAEQALHKVGLGLTNRVQFPNLRTTLSLGAPSPGPPNIHNLTGWFLWSPS